MFQLTYKFVEWNYSTKVTKQICTKKVQIGISWDLEFVSYELKRRNWSTLPKQSPRKLPPMLLILTRGQRWSSISQVQRRAESKWKTNLYVLLVPVCMTNSPTKLVYKFIVLVRMLHFLLFNSYDTNSKSQLIPICTFFVQICLVTFGI